MSIVSYVFGIVAALLALVAVVELLRRSMLRERHAVWWLLGGVLALVIAIFPQLLTWAAKVLGVSVPSNLVFFIAIGLLFLVSLQYGGELTRVEDNMRTLAEQTAFHDERLRRLEQERKDTAAHGEPPNGDATLRPGGEQATDMRSPPGKGRGREPELGSVHEP